jgi:hypothetical protein
MSPWGVGGDGGDDRGDERLGHVVAHLVEDQQVRPWGSPSELL